MAITGWTGLWNNEGGATYATRASRAVLRRLRQALRGKTGRRQRELLVTVTGAAAGSAALATDARIKAEHTGVVAGELGGLRTIETHTLVDRNTVAGDITAIDTKVDLDPYALDTTDLSGNGGGGKVGF